MIVRAIGWGALACWLSTTAVSGLDVRVDPGGGAPRLQVNGEPVRAWMFWGAPGSMPLSTSPVWKELTFEFVASGSATNGTMHFRFGNTPGVVFLDDIRVVDLDTSRNLIARCDFEAGHESFRRDWTFWPTGEQNTVGTAQVRAGGGRGGSGGLHIKLVKPSNGKWPDYHIYHHPRLKMIKEHRYHVSFWVKAEPARDLTVAFYRPGQTYTRLGGPPDPLESQIKLAAEAGVNFVSFPMEMPWPKPGEVVDWSGVDSACEMVLRANPNALMLPRMGMDPPGWWCAAHPEEMMQWEDGHRGKAVVASSLYRREAAARLSALVKHLESRFPEAIAGYHPCGQNTGEWFYEDTWNSPLNGYAPADLREWRQWLKNRYRNDSTLQHEWGDPAITFESATVPLAAARHAAPAGIFRDPAAERLLIEWAEFQQETMADCVCEFARVVRQASRGQKLVVFFYGYVFEFAAVNNGPATSGHYALRRVLNSPDIDVLCSPISYFDRGPGQSAPSMTAAESVALAGKLWLNEDDTHTYLATGGQPGSADHVTTIEETNHELTRNVAQEAMRNFGTWWMDLGATGWFNDPAMWTVMKRLRPLDEWFLSNPTQFRPEVAAVVDEWSMLRVAAGGTKITRPGIYEARAVLGRMGAPYGQYLLDDVAAGRVQASLYIFLNAWSLSPEQRTNLLSATAGATRLWCYAPGYFEDHRVSQEGMRQLTGFSIKKVKPLKALAFPTEAGKRLGLTKQLGVDSPVEPLFAATDAAAHETLASYPDGSAAVALRGKNLFVGTPGLTGELLQVAARTAGVHLFTEKPCNVYANGPFIAVHASEDGPVALNTGRAGRVSDVISGTFLGYGPQITLPMKRGQTRVLRCQ